MLSMRYFFKPKATLNYPFEKGPSRPRFRGEHALRRYPNGEERCIACKLCEAICPAQAITIEAGPRRRRHAPHHALRHRHGEVHLLRPLPGGLPGRCHRRGPTSSSRPRPREELYYDKDALLANGDRWEREIAEQPPRRRAVSVSAIDGGAPLFFWPSIAVVVHGVCLHGRGVAQSRCTRCCS